MAPMNTDTTYSLILLCSGILSTKCTTTTMYYQYNLTQPLTKNWLQLTAGTVRGAVPAAVARRPRAASFNCASGNLPLHLGNWRLGFKVLSLKLSDKLPFFEMMKRNILTNSFCVLRLSCKLTFTVFLYLNNVFLDVFRFVYKNYFFSRT